MYKETVDPYSLPIQGHCTLMVESSGRQYDTRDLELILTDVEISDPVARRYEVDVPGRDGTLDLTEALGGVYFANRTVKLSFACVNFTTQKHHLLASSLRNLFDGRTVRCTLSDDLAYFWRGRCQVDAERPGAETTDVTITIDAEPHKYSIYGSYEAWKWDPFSFVTGVVTQEEDVVLTGGTTVVPVTLPVDPARGKPSLWLNTGSAQAKLSTQSKWKVLSAGENVFPEIRMSDAHEVTLQLRGSGSVGVDYRVGSL